MAVARFLTIEVGAEDDSTHFNLQYSADGRTWLDYSTASSSPTSPEDLDVGELVAGVYTLDGINSPTGNAAVASQEGNWFRHRLKSAGGYGNWSAPFAPVAEGDADGPLADVADLIDEFGLLPLPFSVDEENDRHKRLLGRALTDAMDQHRLSETIDALYTGTRTDAQGRVLARAERLRAASLALRRPAILKALGMHEPLLQEESEAILALAADLAAQADELTTGLLGGTGDAGKVETGTLTLAEYSPYETWVQDQAAWLGVN